MPDEDIPTGPVAGALPRLGESTALFAPEAVVAGRYRIVRFIAEGGMGEVYEAEDLRGVTELDRGIGTLEA